MRVHGIQGLVRAAMVGVTCCPLLISGTAGAADVTDRPRAVSLADRARDTTSDRAARPHVAPGRETPGAEALRAALEATVAGAVATRADQLAVALSAAPNDPAVRGLAGQVRRGSRWVDYQTLVDEARADRRLEAYRGHRAEAEPTVAGQLALADWCRSQRLIHQERAHLVAVVLLEPDHAAARRRLGDTRVDGRWVPAETLAARRAADRAVAEATRTHRQTLTSLAGRIGAGSVSHDEAVDRLAEFRSPGAIAAMETVLSSAHEPAARCVVAALVLDRSPAATASLVRHAVAARWPAVRREAAAGLAARDPHASVPILLAAFEARWTGAFDVLTGADGSLLCRQTVTSDGPDAIRVAIHDHLVVSRGRPEDAEEASRQAGLAIARGEVDKQQRNAGIEASNDAIAAVLREVTGESIGSDPDAWSRWWESRSESYTDGPRTTETTYSWSSSYAERIPTVVQRIPRTPIVSECLAGGTVVWTETGPVAVDRIRPGDVVLVQDAWTGALSLAPVLEVTARPPERLLAIRAGGSTIRATGGHPFWVVGKGWTIARDLRPEDRLHGLEAPVAVDSVEEEPAPSRAFNLVVADRHTYFCGPEKLLSHDNTPRLHAAHPLPGLTD